MTKETSMVLVTGANRGLGLGFTKAYLQNGWQVFATTRSDSAELNHLKQEYPLLTIISMDVSKMSSVQRGFQQITERTKALDLVINNAGRMGHLYGHIDDDFVEEDAVESLKSNTLGPLWVTKAALPLLKKGKLKKVISISSGLGSIGDNQNGDYYIYRITKAGLNMLNRNLAYDLKPFGITCIALCPGWVKTDMGGKEAPLSVETSVKSMIETIDRVGMHQSGSYLQRTGEPYHTF